MCHRENTLAACSLREIKDNFRSGKFISHKRSSFLLRPLAPLRTHAIGVDDVVIHRASETRLIFGQKRRKCVRADLFAYCIVFILFLYLFLPSVNRQFHLTSSSVFWHSLEKTPVEISVLMHKTHAAAVCQRCGNHDEIICVLLSLSAEETCTQLEMDVVATAYHAELMLMFGNKCF